MHAESVHIACGGNRCGHQELVWAENNNGEGALLAYASGPLVVLADGENGVVRRTLPGHTGRVNCLKWLPNVDCDTNKRSLATANRLVSGDTDGTMIVWRRMDESDDWRVEFTTQLASSSDERDEGSNRTHERVSVSALACTLTTESQDAGTTSVWLCASASSGLVRVWRQTTGDGEWLSVYSHVFDAKRVCECVALTPVGNHGAVVLACGTLDSRIHFFICDGERNEFRSLQSIRGHEDWVRSLTFTQLDGSSDVMLASGAQDGFIRLWRIAVYADPSTLSDSDSTQTLSQRGFLFRVCANERESEVYSLLLESVLPGHEHWVSALDWHPRVDEDTRPLALLSSSMDRSMCIWSPSEASESTVTDDDEEERPWYISTRVGEMGGNTLGFYACAFGPHGRHIATLGRTGSLHVWRREDTADDTWKPVPAPSGHFDSASDCSFEPQGRYLISVSKDQSARIIAPWQDSPSGACEWHEIARPQLHGYDMTCVSFSSARTHLFVSGADEKTLRVFEAPQSFLDSLSAISRLDPLTHDSVCESVRPIGATKTELGLSNKPLDEEDVSSLETAGGAGSTGFEKEVVHARPRVFTQPPFEEDLLQSTLWPETHKLYGHGDGLFAVTASPNGRLIASTCKGTKPQHVAIRLWETDTWTEVACLVLHRLTVVQLAFSNDSRRLLSVSRDRSFAVRDTSACVESSGKALRECDFPLIKHVEKAHDRIIWSGSWSHDDTLIATGSRDKKVKVWAAGETNETYTLAQKLPFKVPVTAVAFMPARNSDNRVLAVGLESGLLTCLREESPNKWVAALVFDASLCHVDSVTRLCWRPRSDDAPQEGEPENLLASCSADGSVRLTRVIL